MAESLEIEAWIPGSTPAIQLLWLSNAYAEAAQLLCEALVEDQFTRQYQSTRVVLHLCRHAAELFFKGAIASKTNELPKNTHRLEWLHAEYLRLFPLQKHHIHLPFSAQALDSEPGLFPGSLEEYQRSHDQRFRYMTDSSGKPFEESESFDVLKYQETVEKFGTELNHMVSRISFGW